MYTLLCFQAYNSHCIILDPKPTNDSKFSGEGLCLLPGQIKQYAFSFLPQSEDVGKVLEVKQIFIDFVAVCVTYKQQYLPVHYAHFFVP